MVDKDLLLAKASSVRRHLKRIKEKSNVDLKSFLSDVDRQEIVMFNLQMAIQNCIDIAAHIISEEGFGIPDSISEMPARLNAALRPSLGGFNWGEAYFTRVSRICTRKT